MARTPPIGTVTRHLARVTVAARAWLALAAGATSAAGQATAIAGAVRDPAGAPLAGALVRAWERSATGAGWVDELAAPRPIATTTGPRGLFRLAAAGPCLLVVEHPDGAGTIAIAFPRCPTIVRTAPLGELDLGPDARGARVGYRGRSLGRFEGQRLRLPAGTYELLVDAGDDAFVVDAEVESGRSRTIDRPLARASIRMEPPTAELAIRPWLEHALDCGTHGSLRLPAAARPLRVRSVAGHGDARAIEERWIEPGDEVVWRPREPRWHAVRILDRQGAGIAGATVATLVVDAGGARAVAVARSGDEGTAHVRTDEQDAVVAVVAPGFAIGEAATAAEQIPLEPEHTLALRLVDDRGQPVSGATVTALPYGPAPRIAVSDGRGVARIAALPARPVALRVEHPEFQLREIELSAADPDIELALDPGAAIAGVVLDGDGAPVAGATVEVRDPANARGTPPRYAMTGANGSFSVGGLPDGIYAIFASKDIDGVTWSGRRVDAYPGAGEWELRLQSEDPLPPRRPRRDGRR